MSKLAQFGAAVAILGIVLTFMGMFPGTLGLDPTEGIGVLQIALTLAGFASLDMGAYIYVKDTWFGGRPYTLGQTVGIRLTLTGLLAAGAIGLADILGFGSHPIGDDLRPLMGPWQAVGVLLGFWMSTLGVVVFALFGELPEEEATLPEDEGSAEEHL